ncbi:MAG: hypothetical protein EKK41_10925 [Hyphomicrobiales bacterium]|nr:MAG: hypothetical protein EKK41_10925 [Hyphomicrobiales bacterium]
MKWLLSLAALLASILACASTAEAGMRCPPGTYVARYSFGIYMCKRPTRPRLACPPGEALSSDLIGTPMCRPYRVIVHQPVEVRRR